MSETPNTVFYQVGQSPMGLVAVFSSRTTGKHFPANTSVAGVPNGFLHTVVHGVSNMPLVHCIQGMTEAQARQALDAAGFVERPKDPSQFAAAPKRWSPPAPAPLGPIAFTVGTRMVGPDGTTPVVVADIFGVDPQEPDEKIFIPAKRIPAPVAAAFTASDKHGLVFAGTEAEARAVLAGFGYQDRGGMDWYTPSQLSFGVMEADADFVGGEGTGLFILPKDEDSPDFDNLRTDHLQTCPDFIGVDDCENTWTILDMTPDEVRTALVALGYTHDPELDGAVGG